MKNWFFHGVCKNPVKKTRGFCPNPAYAQSLLGGEQNHYRAFEIEVSVFNALGSSVESFSERLLSGENEITWDVRSYASGLYFCRIVATTDQSTETQIVKMAIKR